VKSLLAADAAVVDSAAAAEAGAQGWVVAAAPAWAAVAAPATAVAEVVHTLAAAEAWPVARPACRGPRRVRRSARIAAAGRAWGGYQLPVRDPALALAADQTRTLGILAVPAAAELGPAISATSPAGQEALAECAQVDGQLGEI
jgi:hypothetical protein